MTADYRALLDSAAAAARQAGEVLRADLHRPDGPRGSGDKADADDEAERIIRSALLEAAPTFGYVGEETGRRMAAPGEPHVWLVDPNDGTTSYLKGLRGSAVSIGLLRRGVPVLGVGLGFAAPDDRGDRFVWAGGCGARERNGCPVDPPAWPGVIGSNTIVLLSAGAARRPGVNGDLVAPGRFRALPSIAYRLALVACGDGAAAVSVNGPVAWDYAGGHALVRSAGGVLIDESGRPVVYTERGESRTRFCCGGSPAVCAELAGRDWDRVLAARRPDRMPR
jgi:fructose-1,6-bisphosphatase/inositol monophosphatase family enzyme